MPELTRQRDATLAQHAVDSVVAGTVFLGVTAGLAAGAASASTLQRAGSALLVGFGAGLLLLAVAALALAIRLYRDVRAAITLQWKSRALVEHRSAAGG